jgi:hypothetical protein
MGASFGVFGYGGWLPSYQLRRATGTPIDCDISAQSSMIRDGIPKGHARTES